MKLFRRIGILLCALIFSAVLPDRLGAVDQVEGEVVVLNPNGGWSWFGDERAIVDRERGVLLVGSLANRRGAGGNEKDGDVQITTFDLATRKSETTVLHHGLVSYGGGDDHNCPGLLQLAGGDYLAAYAGHNNNNLTYYRRYRQATGRWDEEQHFDWNAAIPGGANFACTYSNLFRFDKANSIWNIVRNHNRCPNFMVSHDDGETWQYGGQILRPSKVGVSENHYVNGYLKYGWRGGERIDVLATECHPRDFNNSLFHGTIEGGKLHDAAGKILDENLFDGEAAQAIDLTPVFRAGTEVDGVRMTRLWMLDVATYADGSVGVLFKARANDSVEDHRFFHAVFRDGAWTWHEIAHAGPRLFNHEEDYTGLGALDPDDPSVIFISTPISPLDGSQFAHHEIFRGQTNDGGANWQWRAITTNSTSDNLRPIVPQWDAQHTTVLWLRGSMTTSQNYDMEVVGWFE